MVSSLQRSSVLQRASSLQRAPSYRGPPLFWGVRPLILSFWPQKFRKTDIFGKNFTKSNIFFKFKKRNIYQRTSCQLPSCQILRKSINIWYLNRPKTYKNYTYQNFQLHLFFKVLDNWQRWKWYRRTHTEKLNRIDSNVSPNNQL